MTKLSNDNAQMYSIQLVHQLTELNKITMIQSGMEPITPQTIRTAVKIVQSLTKLDPSIIRVETGAMSYPQVGNDVGVFIRIHPYPVQLSQKQLTCFISDRSISIDGFFETNYLKLVNLKHNPSSIKLIIHLLKMQISHIINTHITT